MLFRKWRERRRARIARQWMFEKMSLPPVEIPSLLCGDEAEFARRRAEWAAMQPAPGPTVVLDCDEADIEQSVQALLFWQSQTAPWLKTILESHRDSIKFLEAQRIRLVQQATVMASVIDSLIVTHVRPDVLLYKWCHEVPELIDHVSDKVPEDLGEHFKQDAQAWQELVMHYTGMIERADAHYQGRCEQDDDSHDE
jgi:hypothetical protein